MEFIQECEGYLKKCLNFIATLRDIQKDATRTSKDKLEQLKVNFH